MADLTRRAHYSDELTLYPADIERLTSGGVLRLSGLDIHFRGEKPHKTTCKGFVGRGPGFDHEACDCRTLASGTIGKYEGVDPTIYGLDKPLPADETAAKPCQHIFHPAGGEYCVNCGAHFNSVYPRAAEETSAGNIRNKSGKS